MSEPIVREEAVSESSLITMNFRELLRIIIWGAVVGAFTAAVYVLLNKFVFGVVLCRPQSTGSCSQAPAYAATVALIMSVIVGVIVLARARIYRPLLIVLAAVVSLWGLQNDAGSAPWHMVVLAAAVIFGLAYGLYAWLARIRNFILAVVVTVVIVVLIRWVLAA